MLSKIQLFDKLFMYTYVCDIYHLKELCNVDIQIDHIYRQKMISNLELIVDYANIKRRRSVYIQI